MELNGLVVWYKVRTPESFNVGVKEKGDLMGIQGRLFIKTGSVSLMIQRRLNL